MGKKILVLGGTGNIGHALAEELLSRGHQVTAAGLPSKWITLPAEIPVVNVDRADEAALAQLQQKEKFEIVYDMTVFTGEQAEADFRVFRDCEHVVITSSAAVYGVCAIEDIPVREDAPRYPERAYGIGKVQMENSAFAHYYKDNWRVTIIRPSSCYGTQPVLFREIGVESSWVDRIRKGKPFIVGAQQLMRSALHVRDVALGFALVIEHPRHTIGQAYNLVGERTTSWEQWHRTAMDVLGKEVEMVEVPLPTLEQYHPAIEQYKMSWQYHGYFSGEKLRRHLPEFTERVSLKDGIAGQIAFLDRNGLIPNSDEITWEDACIAAQLQTRVK